MTGTARGMSELLEPICPVTSFADGCHDELAAAPYDALAPAELDEPVAALVPLTAALEATGIPRPVRERAAART